VTLISQSIISPLLLSSMFPMKPSKTTRSLTQEERKKMTLSPELKQILVGLLLGDLYAEKQKTSVNIRIIFRQSIIAGIYDSAHLIFHGPSVHRKIGVIKIIYFICMTNRRNLRFGAPNFSWAFGP
jgi:hypothetical protein